MGVNLYLIWNNECVADLGRVYYYDNDDIDPNLRHKTIEKVMGYRGYDPKNLDEHNKITDDLVDSITYLYQEVYRKGQIELLNNLREQGFETMTDMEWEERQHTIQNED